MICQIRCAVFQDRVREGGQRPGEGRQLGALAYVLDGAVMHSETPSKSSVSPWDTLGRRPWNRTPTESVTTAAGWRGLSGTTVGICRNRWRRFIGPPAEIYRNGWRIRPGIRTRSFLVTGRTVSPENGQERTSLSHRKLG